MDIINIRKMIQIRFIASQYIADAYTYLHIYKDPYNT